MHYPSSPILKTLRRKPSWTNRAGRVDRSACIEVRASELWRYCLDMRPAATGDGRLAAGTVTMHVQWLRKLHEKRPAFELQGDFRTAKSNAMKPPPLLIDGKPVREQSWPLNPNRSAGRTKMLGLWSGTELAYERLGPWKQEIRVERWQRKARTKTKMKPKPAEASRRSAPPAHQHFIICPRCERKVSKLFMVLCTLEEVADAEFAEAWISLVDAKHIKTRLTPPAGLLKLRARMIDRYGLLFRARRLVCRTCLGVRYGQVRDPDRRIDPYPREKMLRDMARGYETNRPR